jgi:hypothetical protein
MFQELESGDASVAFRHEQNTDADEDSTRNEDRQAKLKPRPRQPLRLEPRYR